MAHQPRLVWLLSASIAVVLSTSHLTGAPQAARQGSSNRRFLVVARSAADLDALRADVVSAAGKVATDLAQVGMLAVTGSDQVRQRLRASVFAAGVATDHIVRLIQ